MFNNTRLSYKILETGCKIVAIRVKERSRRYIISECNLAIMGNETVSQRMPIVSAGIITPVIAPAYFTDMGQCTLSAMLIPLLFDRCMANDD